MKIGILGGTFNPIHTAHVYIAKLYFDAIELDKLIFIPTFVPPHKPAAGLASAGQRLDMCRIAVNEYPGFEICDFEIKRQCKSYTYLTLEYLSGQYPQAVFFLIMGADMFLTMQDWKHPEKIYKMAVLCAAKREGEENLLLEAQAERLGSKGARCIILDMEPVELSSTLIRENIAAGKDVSGLLHPGVLEYIERNGIYG